MTISNYLKAGVVAVATTLAATVSFAEIKAVNGVASYPDGGVRLIRTRFCLDSIAALYATPSWRHSARAAVRFSLK